MKQRFLFKYISIFALLNLSFVSFASMPQNVSGLVITTASKIDICCATISSQIDQLVNVDFNGTFTALNACCSCNPIPLTVSAAGTTITSAGVYCLTNDVVLNQPSTIAIDQNNVTFDLNGHTIFANPISPSDTIITIGVAQTPTGVTIQNGSISSNSNGQAIAMGNSCNNIILQNLMFDLVDSGVVINDPLITVTNISCNDIEVHGINGTGFLFNNVTQAVCENCTVANGGVNVSNSKGYSISGICDCISFINCSAESLRYRGFEVLITGTGNLSFQNCKACQIEQDGFYVNNSLGGQYINFDSCASNLNTIGFNFFGTQNEVSNAYIFKNCSAVGNAQDGFYLGLSSGVCKDCVAEGNGTNGFEIFSFLWEFTRCSANRNNQIGFYYNGQANGTIFNDNVASFNGISGFAGTGNELLFANCLAANNGSIGFDLAQAGTASIGNCIAHSNPIGFNGPTNSNAIFYSNSASNNTTNNYANVSNVVPLGSNTFVFGGNLSA